MPQTNPRRKQGAAPPAARGRGQQQAGYNPRARSYGSTPTPVRSVRVGDMGFNSGHARAQASYRRYLRRLAIIALIVAVIVGGGVALYTSSLFPITNVSVQGVKHLTTAEMTQLASVPATTTLLRVDAAGIKGRLLQNAWVKDASVNRVFPETLELAITERTIAAVAHVPV
ncbi:MAG: FtsQ-type POTRA domain-containing protein, partial [Raoultibacter sp.]